MIEVVQRKVADEHLVLQLGLNEIGREKREGKEESEICAGASHQRGIIDAGLSNGTLLAKKETVRANANSCGCLKQVEIVTLLATFCSWWKNRCKMDTAASTVHCVRASMRHALQNGVHKTASLHRARACCWNCGRAPRRRNL